MKNAVMTWDVFWTVAIKAPKGPWFLDGQEHPTRAKAAREAQSIAEHRSWMGMSGKVKVVKCQTSAFLD